MLVKANSVDGADVTTDVSVEVSGIVTYGSSTSTMERLRLPGPSSSTSSDCFSVDNELIAFIGLYFGVYLLIVLMFDTGEAVTIARTARKCSTRNFHTINVNLKSS